MSPADLDLSGVAEAARRGLATLAGALRELAGENLLGLCAFGGCVTGDTLHGGAAAQSVAVLERVDLEMLDRLASAGARFGRQQVRAPLIMTPGYIRASDDVFPLELLEIQQTGTLIWGRDYFSELSFRPAHVRLQCERELKSELIQLRQRLLAVAGNHKALYDVCLAAVERCVRVLRGVLYLGGCPPLRTVNEIVGRAAQVAGVPLGTLKNLLAGDARSSLGMFQRFYREVEALAEYVDKLDGGPAGT